MRIGVIIIIVVLVVAAIFPIFIVSSRKANLAEQNRTNQNRPNLMIPPAPKPEMFDTISSDSSHADSFSNASVASPDTSSDKAVQPFSQNRSTIILTSMIIPVLIVVVIIFLIIRSAARKKKRQYTPTSTTTSAYGSSYSASQAPAVFAPYHGGMGEPYCSEACYNEAGRYISAVLFRNQSGVCGFCQKPVQVSAYGQSNCAVIPYEGVNLFICSSCAGKGRAYLKIYNKCCMCQKDLTSPVATPIVRETKKPNNDLVIKKMITDRHLRPLGNKKRLEPYGKSGDYNVRVLYFNSRENAAKYYQLIKSFAEKTPPPAFCEMILLYIPKNIYAEKYAVILPNEYYDAAGNYKSWLKNCFLTCNETLRIQTSTDHMYSELHKYAECVYEWTILAPKEFDPSMESFEDIFSDDEANSYPALKMLGDKDTATPPEKPNPDGEWVGVVFNIARFEEAFYGKASIKLLTQIVGQEKLASTVVHGGDLLPDVANWCLAIHTGSSEQFNTIKNAVGQSDDPHFLSNGKRIIGMNGPSQFSLVYQGFFSDKGEYIGA